MDKPQSLSVKDYVMRKMSISMNIPLKTIETVVGHQFEGLNEAFRQHHTVEISGFGKFILNYKKTIKALEKNYSKVKGCEKFLLDETLTEQKRASWELKRTNALKQIELLTKKVDRPNE